MSNKWLIILSIEQKYICYIFIYHIPSKSTFLECWAQICSFFSDIENIFDWERNCTLYLGEGNIFPYIM